jgi:metal-responsive CopG/Arc/MetJ family transcriptional regulator
MEQLDGGEKLEEKEDYVGVITLVYNHHSTSFVKKNLEIQHEFEDVIGVTTHIHMTHEKCYEMIQVRGKGKRLGRKSRYQTLFTRIMNEEKMDETEEIILQFAHLLVLSLYLLF